MPRDATKEKGPGEMNLGGFLETVNFGEFYSYPGGFTTPPCTEGIQFFIMKDVQKITLTQLQSFTKYWAGNATFAAGKGNNRLVQPLNDRVLRRSNDGSVAIGKFLNFNSGFVNSAAGPTTTQVTLSAVLVPVLTIAFLIVVLFAWKNYHLKQLLSQKEGTQLAAK